MRLKGKKILTLGLAGFVALSSMSVASPVEAQAAKKVKTKSVRLNRKKVTIVKGKKLKLKAKVAPKNAANKKLVWKSSKKSVVRVSQKGMIKGIKKGTAKITVTVKGTKKKAVCKVTVKNSARVTIQNTNNQPITQPATQPAQQTTQPATQPTTTGQQATTTTPATTKATQETTTKATQPTTTKASQETTTKATQPTTTKVTQPTTTKAGQETTTKATQPTTTKASQETTTKATQPTTTKVTQPTTTKAGQETTTKATQPTTTKANQQTTTEPEATTEETTTSAEETTVPEPTTEEPTVPVPTTNTQETTTGEEPTASVPVTTKANETTTNNTETTSRNVEETTSFNTDFPEFDTVPEEEQIHLKEFSNEDGFQREVETKIFDYEGKYRREVYSVEGYLEKLQIGKAKFVFDVVPEKVEIKEVNYEGWNYELYVTYNGKTQVLCLKYKTNLLNVLPDSCIYVGEGGIKYKTSTSDYFVDERGQVNIRIIMKETSDEPDWSAVEFNVPDGSDVTYEKVVENGKNCLKITKGSELIGVFPVVFEKSVNFGFRDFFVPGNDIVNVTREHLNEYDNIIAVLLVHGKNPTMGDIMFEMVDEEVQADYQPFDDNERYEGILTLTYKTQKRVYYVAYEQVTE